MKADNDAKLDWGRLHDRDRRVAPAWLGLVPNQVPLRNGAEHLRVG